MGFRPTDAAAATWPEREPSKRRSTWGIIEPTYVLGGANEPGCLDSIGLPQLAACLHPSPLFHLGAVNVTATDARVVLVRHEGREHRLAGSNQTQALCVWCRCGEQERAGTPLDSRKGTTGSLNALAIKD
nr:unnamed protein product [Digitaria exilis]